MRHAVGIDIGGTAMKVAVVSENGGLSHASSVATRCDDPPSATLERLGDAVRPILEIAATESGVPPSEVPVGVGCAGLVSAEDGIVLVSPNIPTWRNVPLGPALASDLGAPVWVFNDANAFVLGEGRLGAGRGSRILLGLTLGTGVGGGILIEGRLYTGADGFAGEMGHVPIDPGGPSCACGGRGCLEVFAGGRGIVERYLSLRGGASDLEKGAGGITPEDLHRAAVAGDGNAAEAFRVAGEYLGIALGGLTTVFNPDRIVIGGGVAQAGDFILGPARTRMMETAMFGAEWCPELSPATLGPEAGVIGAAVEALNRAASSG